MNTQNQQRVSHNNIFFFIHFLSKVLCMWITKKGKQNYGPKFYLQPWKASRQRNWTKWHVLSECLSRSPPFSAMDSFSLIISPTTTQALRIDNIQIRSKAAALQRRSQLSYESVGYLKFLVNAWCTHIYLYINIACVCIYVPDSLAASSAIH